MIKWPNFWLLNIVLPFPYAAILLHHMGSQKNHELVLSHSKVCDRFLSLKTTDVRCEVHVGQTVIGAPAAFSAKRKPVAREILRLEEQKTFSINALQLKSAKPGPRPFPFPGRSPAFHSKSGVISSLDSKRSELRTCGFVKNRVRERAW